MSYGPRYTLHKFLGNEREIFTGDFKDDYVMSNRVLFQSISHSRLSSSLFLVALFSFAPFQSYASGLERRSMEPDESAASVHSRPLVIHLDDTLYAPPPKPSEPRRTKIRRMCPDDYDKGGLDYESGKRRQARRAAQEDSQPQSSRQDLLVINCGQDEPSPVAGPSSPSETSTEPKLESIAKVLRSHSLTSIEKLKTALEKTKGKMRSRAQSSVDQTLSNANPERIRKRRGLVLDPEALQGALKEEFGLEIDPDLISGYADAMPSQQSHDSDASVYSQESHDSDASVYSQSSG